MCVVQVLFDNYSRSKSPEAGRMVFSYTASLFRLTLHPDTDNSQYLYQDVWLPLSSPRLWKPVRLLAAEFITMKSNIILRCTTKDSN